jgi:hypothetical protein
MLFTFKKRDSLLSYLTRSPLSSTFWSLAGAQFAFTKPIASSKLREDRTEKARSSLNHSAIVLSRPEIRSNSPNYQ